MTSHRVAEGHDLHLRISERRLSEGRRSGRHLAGSHVVTSAVKGLRKSWWITTALLLLIGAIARFDLITRDDLGPLGRDDEITAGEQLDIATLAEAFDLYPMIHYAGIDLALIDFRAIPVNNSGRPIVVADLAVRNTSAVQIRAPLSLISLVGPDGEVTALDRLEYAEHSLRLVIDPGESEQVLAVFKLDSALVSDVGDYAIEVGESGRWPEELPLDGEAAASAYPQPLQPVEGGEIEEGAIDSIRHGELDIEVTEAAASLQYGAYRAPIGQHLAVLTVSLSGDSEDVQKAMLDQDLWTMADADGSRRPIRVKVLEKSIAGDSLVQQLVFYYGTDATDLTLQVGSRLEQQIAAEFTVDPLN